MESKLIKMLSALLLLLSVYACDKRSSDITRPNGNVVEEPIGMGTISTPYYTASLIREREIVVREIEGSFFACDGPSFKAERTMLCVLFGGETVSGRENPQFRRLADSVGDGHNTERLGSGVLPQMLVSNVKAMSLESLSGYNASHPAGSSLNDLVRVSYSTYKYRLVEEAAPAEYFSSLVGSPVIKLKTLEQVLPLEKIAVFGNVPASDSPHAEHLYPAFHLTFVEAPDKPAQEMKLTVTLSNGQILERTFSVGIKELK